jgi:hypothetical protein
MGKKAQGVRRENGKGEKGERRQRMKDRESVTG